MADKLKDIRDLINEQITPWVWDYLLRFAEQARINGNTPDEILTAFGLYEPLSAGPTEIPSKARALRKRYAELRSRGKTEEERIELRDLAEACIDAGMSKKQLESYLGVTKGTVRNLLNPWYMSQTEEERAAYRAARRAAARDRKDLLG